MSTNRLPGAALRNVLTTPVAAAHLAAAAASAGATAAATSAAGLEKAILVQIAGAAQAAGAAEASPAAAGKFMTAMHSKHQMKMMGEHTRGRLEPGRSSIADVSRGVGRLEQALTGAPDGHPAFAPLRQFQAYMGEARAIGLPGSAGMNTLLAVPGRQVGMEQALHNAITGVPGAAGQIEAAHAADTQRILGELLAAVQNQTGQSPLGYPPGAFGIGAPQVRPGMIAAEAGVGAPRGAAVMPGEMGPVTGPPPVPLDQRAAEAKSVAEELKAARADMAKAVMNTLPFGKKDPAAPTIGDVAKRLKAAQEKAVGMLEQAGSPEEAKVIAAELGGTKFKHEISGDEKLVDRLNGVAQKNQMPALGFTVSGKQLKDIQKQIKEADGDKAVSLAENKTLMENASPEEKAALVKKLDSGACGGGPNEKNSMAIHKVLSSCKSKEEYDQVLNAAGGKKLLDRVTGGAMGAAMGGSEAAKKMNELAAGWGRMDVVTLPKHAQKFEGILADPKRSAELSQVRPPTAGEVAGAGGNFKLDGLDKNDPLVAQAGQAMGAVKGNIAKKAFDIDYDQQSKTELILEQRRREVDGKPKLDYTSLVAQAEKISGAPDSEIREWAKKNAGIFGPPDWAKDSSKPIPKDDKEKFITEKMDGLRKKNGLSEQTMKQLVTQKMGNVYNEASGEMGAYSQQIVGPLKKQLEEVVKTKGPACPEAVQLQSRIAKFEQAAGPYTKHLGEVGEIYKNMFPVPPSFWETFGKIFSFIADIAAAICAFIPGVGQAVSAAYFGIKTIVNIAQGNVLGAFTSLASAIPGVGSVIGGAVGTALNVGARVVQGAIGVGQGIAEGNIGAVFGGLASAAGGLGGVGGAVGNVATTIGKGLNIAQSAYSVGDGIARGDIGAALGGLSSVAGGVAGIAGPGSPLTKVMDYAQGGIRMVDSFAKGDVAGGIAQGIGMASPHIKDAGVKNVLDHVQKGLPAVDSLMRGDIGGALGTVAGQLGSLTGNPQAQQALGLVSSGARFATALGNGDYASALGQLSQGAGQFAGQLGGDIGRGAQQFLNSPGFRNAMDLTQSGTQFIQGIASGDMDRALGAVGGLSAGLGQAVPQLRSTLQTMTPMVQSMARGDFGGALGQLAQSPLTQDLAGKLGVLQPLSDLARGTGLGSLQELGRTVGQVAGGVAGIVQGNPAAIGQGIDQIVAGIQHAAGPGSAASRVLGLAGSAARIGSSLAGGDIGGALGTVSAELGRIPGGAGKRAAEIVSDGLRFTQALQDGSYAGALTGLAGQLGQLGQSPAATRLAEGMRAVADVMPAGQALQNGDPETLARILGGADGKGGVIQTLGSGILSGALGGIAKAATQVLDSPQLRDAIDLARTGTRFAAALGSADTQKALTEAAGLSGALGRAVPQLQEVLRGQQVQGAFQELLHGQHLKGLEEVRHDLERAAFTAEERHFNLLEQERDLLKYQERFIQNPAGLAQRLILRTQMD